MTQDRIDLDNVPTQSTPVEPFGGTDNFDVSSAHIVYTTKDPNVNPATHTRQDIYIVPIKGGEPPRRLTSGTQGATNSPVFNKQGTKIAWTEMAEDGYEADRKVDLFSVSLWFLLYLIIHIERRLSFMIWKKTSGLL